MNDRAVPAIVKAEIPSLAMQEDELVRVMQNSVYPGAQIESIKLVLGYCRAMQLDPMTKPVHIVPMDVKTKDANNKDTYTKRDVIMPGIELYRTKAARSGEYAGCSEPEFGPSVKLAFKSKQWVDNGNGGRSEKWVDGEIEYPEFCKVTVRRIVEGREVEFTAVEYWIENYATAGRDSTAPNAMWKKRPRGQLAKCTEAQALRKAFPEVGAVPTVEEMEGRTLGDEPVIIDAARVAMPRETAAPTAQPASTGARAEGDTAAGQGAQEPPAKSGEVLPPEKKAEPSNGSGAKPASSSQIAMIRTKAKQATITEQEIAKRFHLAEGADPLAGITTDQGNEILSWLRNPS
jgi:phage recombination protein Bet